MLRVSIIVLRRACLVAVLLGFAASSAQAAICRVTPGTDASGDGSDWGAQAKRLPAALADASCDEIWVQQGLYKPVVPAAATPTPAERAISFAINRPLQLYGGFFGDETALDQRHGTAPTVLSADIDNNDTNLDGNHIAEGPADNLGANSFHVLVIGGVGAAGNGTYTPANTVLDGLVVTAGRAEGVELYHTHGGGLFCNGENANCSPRLNRITFSGNLAARGGAIYNSGYVGASNPRIENATFSGNTASQFGGAIHNYGFAGQSSPTIANTTFSDNHSDDDGGAIYSNGSFGASFPTLSFVTASGNTADDCGGAIFNFNDASIVVHRSILWGNTSAFLPGSEICNNNDGLSTIVNSIAASGCVPGDTCINADPHLGPLQDNGGTTFTRLPGAGSAAIDAATACTDVANVPLPADQRGVARPQAANCDLGAVESRHYTLDVVATGPGSVSAANPPAPIAGSIAACAAGSGTCSAVYPEGFAVPLLAAADIGYRLNAANSCGGTLAGNTFTTAPLSGNCTVAADFVRNPPGTIAFGTLVGIDAPEGNGGTRTLSIPLTLSEDTAEPVTLAYTLAPASGSAGMVASDFSSAATGSVEFPAGLQDATLTLDIAAEDVVEPDEAFALGFALSSTIPSTSTPNAMLATDVAAGLEPILRNDDSAALTLADASASENAGTLPLPWTLSAPVQGGFSLLYATQDGTATAGADYTATAGELLHDGSTTTAYAITVPLLDDDAFEPQETLLAQVGPPTCTFSPCDVSVNDATGRIDDDEAPVAGLAITLDNHVDASDPGDVVTYRIVVSHHGSAPAIGVTLAEVMPAALQDATWTCSSTAGASCSAPSGTGPLALSVDLPDGGQAMLDVVATVGAFDPTLDYTVTLTPPGGYVDPDLGDNSATDSDVIRSVFGDDFE